MLLRIQQITGGAQQTLASVGVFPAAEIGVRPAAAMLLTVAMVMVVGEEPRFMPAEQSRARCRLATGGVGSMKNSVKLVTLMVALSVTSAVAADWPWIYGPRRDHTSEQKGLLRTWPQGGPKVLWTVPVGAGFGGPAVSGANVYLLDRDESVGDTLRVLDLASGKELWTFNGPTKSSTKRDASFSERLHPFFRVPCWDGQEWLRRRCVGPITGSQAAGRDR